MALEFCVFWTPVLKQLLEVTHHRDWVGETSQERTAEITGAQAGLRLTEETKWEPNPVMPKPSRRSSPPAAFRRSGQGKCPGPPIRPLAGSSPGRWAASCPPARPGDGARQLLPRPFVLAPPRPGYGAPAAVGGPAQPPARSLPSSRARPAGGRAAKPGSADRGQRPGLTPDPPPPPESASPGLPADSGGGPAVGSAAPGTPLGKGSGEGGAGDAAGRRRARGG
ncbi:basic proline-rich protein-like [Bubalus kerabau]|uniref:basic proline-rich protein-like n=1 Tax=Bubalus carabanensis TaxID=3119969 RepID=UPI00244E994B|nr:basic proline-rich protein-like [Bubalus carabanensis]